MKGILGDVNVPGQVKMLFRRLESPDWKEVWDSLALEVRSLAELGLPLNASDVLVWQACQREEIVLITNNRNAAGPDSLEETIRLHNTIASLPVLTFSDAEKMNHSREYAERVVERLLEILLDIDAYRGAGRLYLP
jgi:hypothetical protein